MKTMKEEDNGMIEWSEVKGSEGDCRWVRGGFAEVVSAAHRVAHLQRVGWGHLM